jgi:membrane dipeptidase
MVPFVTMFVSKAVKDDEDTIQARIAAALKQNNGDTARARVEVDSWRAAHPRPRATIGDVADVIEHVRKVAGVDHVGIGSDFDGITETVVGLEDVSKFPALFAELARRGWSETDLEKLAGGNILRVMRDAERAAARLQRERGPSIATIEQLDGPRRITP